MKGWFAVVKNGGLLALLLTAICLGGYSSLLSYRLELARRQNAEQQKALTQQSGLISTLQAQDRKNRALEAAQQQREQQLRQQAEIYQRKYREAIQNDECASSSAPDAVLGLLHGTDTAATGSDRPITP